MGKDFSGPVKQMNVVSLGTPVTQRNRRSVNFASRQSNENVDALPRNPEVGFAVLSATVKTTITASACLCCQLLRLTGRDEMPLLTMENGTVLRFLSKPCLAL